MNINKLEYFQSIMLSGSDKYLWISDKTLAAYSSSSLELSNAIESLTLDWFLSLTSLDFKTASSLMESISRINSLCAASRPTSLWG